MFTRAGSAKRLGRAVLFHRNVAEAISPARIIPLDAGLKMALRPGSSAAVLHVLTDVEDSEARLRAAFGDLHNFWRLDASGLACPGWIPFADSLLAL